MGKTKLKIYLCDCSHNYLGVGTHMFPLNIAYVASYAKKIFPKEVDIKLFKYPEDFINQFKKDTPLVVGFSNYVWNVDLNNKLSRWIKSISPEIVTVFGGPNINYSPQGYKRFFATQDAVDFYIPHEGETPFVNLLKEIFGNGLNLSSSKRKPIDGVIFYDKDSDSVIQGQFTPRIEDLDNVPSPYITGLLDEFFERSLIPIMETNRGCPYTCTYCAQGLSSHNRVIFFNLERVKEDIRYIASKMKNTNILHFADANFGIAPRDLEIARFLAKTKEEDGRLRKFNTNWAKNQPRLFELAKILTNANLCISLQSMDETVLRNIKRSNIKLSIFKDSLDKVNEIGGASESELILGLPGETKESHIQAIRKLFDWNISRIICYNLILLDGTEMSLDRDKDTSKTKTKFRLIDDSFGRYLHITSLEVEEGIRSTPTITEEEILYFRPIHWLIHFLWNYRFYFDLLKYLQSIQINPLDYMLKLIEDADKSSTPQDIRHVFNEFREEAQREWFDSPKELRRYYTQPEKFKLLKEGRAGGKMNYKYMMRVLLENRAGFEKYLYQTAVNYSSICQSKKLIFEDILKFLSASIVDFSKSWKEICKDRSISCKYNIVEWRNSRYKRDLEEFYHQEGVRFNFYLPEDQKQSIKTLLKQYGAECKNITLRKMSEYMDLTDFMYKAKMV